MYPPLADLPFPPLPRGASLGVSRTNLAALRPTTNAGQVRAYELGDSFRHIHWPSTAHREELMVKMFDQEASADVWLLVDTDPTVQSGQGDTATEEMGVIVAASLANDLLREGRAVGLITYTPERNIVWPARSTGQLWNLLGQLARLPNASARPGRPSGDSEREATRPRQAGLRLAHALREWITRRWEQVRLARRRRETPDVPGTLLRGGRRSTRRAACPRAQTSRSPAARRIERGGHYAIERPDLDLWPGAVGLAANHSNRHPARRFTCDDGAIGRARHRLPYGALRYSPACSPGDGQDAALGIQDAVHRPRGQADGERAMMGEAVTTRNGDRLMMAIAGICAFLLPVSLAEAEWAPRPAALAFVVFAEPGVQYLDRATAIASRRAMASRHRCRAGAGDE